MQKIADYIRKNLDFQAAGRLYLDDGCQDASLRETMRIAYRDLQASLDTLADAPFSRDETSVFRTLRRIKKFRKQVAVHNFCRETTEKQLRNLSEPERQAKIQQMEDIGLAPDALRAQDCFKSLATERLSYDAEIRTWLRGNDPELLARLDQYVDSEKPKPAWEDLTKDQKAACMGAHLLGDSVSFAFKIARAVAPRLTCHFLAAIKDMGEDLAFQKFEKELAARKPSTLTPS